MTKSIGFLFVLISACSAPLSQNDLVKKQEIEITFEKSDYQKCLTLINSITNKKGIEKDSSLSVIQAQSLIKSRRYKEAIDRYGRIRRETKFIRIEDYYVLIADAYKGMSQYESALVYYDSALAYPSKMPVMLDRAIAYNYLGQFDKAINDCRTLLSLSRDTLVLIGACLNLSDFYLQVERFDSSRFYIQKTIEFKGYTDDALLAFAVYYYRTNKMDSALVCTNIVTDVAPEKPYAFTLRGKLFYKQGKGDLACDDWKHALRLGDTEAEDLYNKYCYNPFK